MKQCRYVRIPENPRDVRLIWEQAELLNLAALPDWLDQEDAAGYRFVGWAPQPIEPSADTAALISELDEHESAGLIVDPDVNEPGPHRIYIAVPRREPIWSIGIYEGDSPLALSPSPRVQNPVLTADDVTDVPAVFVADPFVLPPQTAYHVADAAGSGDRDARWHMFFEVLNWRSNKGEIGWATSPDGCQWQYRQIVLAEEFHLSYPYVFAADGDVFMVPESHDAGAVRLYRAIEFPIRWTFAATLLEGGYFADASILRHTGRWWMFVETSSSQDHDTLRLYHADHVIGPWREHPSSPVVSGNASTARPAGRVLVAGDQIVRFAQNCSTAYGLDVRAIQITELTPSAYADREITGNPILAGSGAGWNARGMHHVDMVQLTDGRWRACVDGWTE